MNQLMRMAGRAAGGFGVLLCLVAGLARLSGSYYVVGLEATTVFLVGTGLMVFACMLRLETMSSQA